MIPWHLSPKTFGIKLMDNQGQHIGEAGIRFGKTTSSFLGILPIIDYYQRDFKIPASLLLKAT
jgi:hypothetical protein